MFILTPRQGALRDHHRRPHHLLLTIRFKQRLTKDFVGARLEAEDILRKKQRQTQACNIGGETAGASSDASPRDADTIPSAATTENSVKPLSSRVLSALRRRELELGNPVAILDDKMTRARPAGLLAASVSADVSVTSSHSLTNAVVGDSNNVGGLRTAAAHTAPPDQHRHGRRCRRLSLPSVGVVVGEGGKEGAAGESDEGRRPWTTLCHGGDAGAWAGEDEGDGGDRRSGGFKELEPLRFGITKLTAEVGGCIDCMPSQWIFSKASVCVG